jgi:hypothetical protein
VDGSFTVVRLSQDEWETLIPAAYPGYLSREDYQQNQKRLHESGQAIGSDRRQSPPAKVQHCCKD